MSSAVGLGFLSSLVDRFIPPKLKQGSPDELRRARLTVVFSLAMFVNSVPDVVVLLRGRVWTVGSVVTFVMLVYFTNPFLLRLVGSTKVAAHVLVTSVAGTLLVTSAFSGGLFSPGLAWWGATLIFAVMLLGTRVGLFWTIIAAGDCIAYIVLHKNGIQVRDDIAHLDRHEPLGSSYATAFIAFFLLVRVYENLKTSMLEEVGAAKRSAEQAHRNARVVLDNVAQGLVVADATGMAGNERSEALDRWFGPLSRSESIFSYFNKLDPRFAAWLEVGWSTVFEDVLPLDVCIAQLPTRFVYADRHYSVTYRPIAAPLLPAPLTPVVDAGVPSVPNSDPIISAVLIVVTDVTEVVIAERAQEEQRELLAILQRAMTDRGILLEFVDESRRRIDALCNSELDPVIQRRELHTLKGNAGVFGLIRAPRLCHELEDKMAQEGGGLSKEDCAALCEHWDHIEAEIMRLLGDPIASIQLSMSEYHCALDAVAEEQPHAALHARMRSWAHEPTHTRLEVFAEQITTLARRLGKGEVTVQLDDGGVRLPRRVLRDFWSSFAHLVRNAVDHGLESPDERQHCGKPLHPRIEIVTRIERGDATIEIADDGRGIDWIALAEAARAKGLPTETREQLEAALFGDGVTTRSNVTDYSGRGVGLAAVRSVVHALGGTISIESIKGQGTRFTFRFSLARLRPSLACPPVANELQADAAGALTGS